MPPLVVALFTRRLAPPPEGQLRHLLAMTLLLLPRVAAVAVALAAWRHVFAALLLLLLVWVPHPLRLLPRVGHGAPVPLLPLRLLLGGVPIAMRRDH